MLLVSGSTRTVGDLAKRWPRRLGHLVTPRNRNSMRSLLATELMWAADNGAYSGFDAKSFRVFLRKISLRPRCLFVACPDVVCDARATRDRFGEWAIEVRQTGQPVAFVGQDGAEDMELPWPDFDAWFVGGSTRWKLSQASADLCAEAKSRGKFIHIGRVNSLRRLRAAFDMGADSVDGSSASMFGDKYIHTFCSWIESLHCQPTLFDQRLEATP